MFLIESIRRNVWLISYHFNIWVLKVSIVFLAFTPLFNDQNCISYLSQLILQSNTKGLMDMFNVSEVQFPILLGSMVVLISGLLFFIDTLFEAGFLSTYIKKQKKYFWNSINSYCKRLFKINGVCFFPKLAIFTFMILLFDTFYNPHKLLFSITFIGLAFSILFYVIKVIDTIKLNYVLRGEALNASIINGIRSLITTIKSDWLLNICYGFCLILFLVSFVYLEKILELEFSNVILLAVSFQQLFVLIRQIARYTYLGAIITLEFDVTKVPERNHILKMESIS